MSELVARNGSLLVWKASQAWKFLNGTINVYKPAEMTTGRVINAIKTNLVKGKQVCFFTHKDQVNRYYVQITFNSIDLNELEPDEPKPLVQIQSVDNESYDIQLVPNLGQSRLATGPRYTEKFLRIHPAEQLGYHTSGVLGKVSIVWKIFQFKNSNKCRSIV